MIKLKFKYLHGSIHFYNAKKNRMNEFEVEKCGLLENVKYCSLKNNNMYKKSSQLRLYL